MKLERIILTRVQSLLAALLAVATIACVARAEEDVEETTKRVEYPSPDGKLALLYTATGEDRAYDLIEKKSGKVLTRVSEAEPEMGPSSRFIIDKVLWKADSSAFAVTLWLFKRGSTVLVFKRTPSGYEEVKLPDLQAEIPDKLTQGKDFHHIYILNSETAMRWQKNGSLTVQIENALDGDDGIVTAKRTVELSFDGTDKPKIENSTVKYSTEKEPLPSKSGGGEARRRGQPIQFLANFSRAFSKHVLSCSRSAARLPHHVRLHLLHGMPRQLDAPHTAYERSQP